MAKKLFYKIGEACKLLDIQPYVLRYWETEFPFLSPGKSKSGQRVYSAKEIELIRRIKALLYDEGYTIAGAKKRLETDLPGILESENLDDLDFDEVALAARLAAPAAAAPAAVLSAAAASPATAAADDAVVAGDTAIAADAETASLKSVLDTNAAQTIKTLRAGISSALEEAKGILTLLETPRRRTAANRPPPGGK